MHQRGNEFHVTATSYLSILKFPWEQTYEVELIIRSSKDRPLFLNQTRCTTEEREGLRFIRCKVTPDGNVSFFDRS